MGNSVSLQTLEFFYSALLGVGLGALFDFFRIVRFCLPDKKLITMFFDVLFWLCAICALLVFVLTVSDGKMRWYVLVGTFCGGFVYVSALSEIIFRVGVSAVFMLKKLLWLATRPLYGFLRWMWRKMLLVGRKVFRVEKLKEGGESHEKKQKFKEEKAQNRTFT